MKPLSFDTLRGNWATLLLATDDKGHIDFTRQADEIDILIASKPNGIYSNGTAGEFYSQNLDEFVCLNQLLTEKCEAAGVAFQIGVSHPCAQESLVRLQLISELEPADVQVILPDWF
ncbi:MAG: dihydrodipicolinate synthase family protein, partial [Alistipes sp.]|nr:dihydrodipicolinate synthase family protein [Alistipes sp.]